MNSLLPAYSVSLPPPPRYPEKLNFPRKFERASKNKSLWLVFFFRHAQLIKPQNGFLGIVLVGGADTPLENHYVNDILPNSSASKSGRVRTGDELLEANGQALRGKTHAQALTIFRSLPAVVTLVVARSKNANRSIMERYNQEKKDNKKVNNNIVSPKKRRSIVEEAFNSSVIARPLSSVIDVTKKKCPYSKPVKRVSRISSFLGTAEGENDRGETQRRNHEVKNENRNKKSREEPGVGFSSSLGWA